MQVDPSAVVHFLAWLASGLAAVVLTPANRAARALVAAGILLSVAWLLEAAATEPPAAGERAEALLRIAADGCFLLGLAAVVTVLATFPDGGLARRGQAVALGVLPGLAVVSAVLRLVGSERVDVGGEPASEVANPFAVVPLEPLGAAGELVVATEPLWILLGVGILLVRWADRRRRAELTPVLASIGLLAVMLVVVLVGIATDRPVAISEPLFLLALSALPVTLLVGISRRTRGLQQALIESRGRLVAAEDQARRALERDLHDGVQQQLIGILTLTELAARQVRSAPAEAGPLLDEVRHEVEAAIGDLRELVRGIRPPALSDSGVAAALDDRFARLPATVGVEHGKVGDRRWPPEVEAAAYFVACEAVTNAVKHATGSRVRVTLTAPGGALRVEVADDGPGFGAAGPGGGGLDGLRDRVESLGGRFDVTSGRPGTVVVAELPGATS